MTLKKFLKKNFLLALFLNLVSCATQLAETYEYDLGSRYEVSKREIQSINKASETNLGWTTGHARFKEEERGAGNEFVFNKVSSVPDLGIYSVFEGVLTKRGNRSRLVLTEKPHTGVGYRDYRSLFRGFAPDPSLVAYDSKVVKRLSVRNRSTKNIPQ